MEKKETTELKLSYSDSLAMERTLLAKERTYLAYFRTPTNTDAPLNIFESEAGK